MRIGYKSINITELIKIIFSRSKYNGENIGRHFYYILCGGIFIIFAVEQLNRPFEFQNTRWNSKYALNKQLFLRHQNGASYHVYRAWHVSIGFYTIRSRARNECREQKAIAERHVDSRLVQLSVAR